jgi:hypothetical protein
MAKPYELEMSELTNTFAWAEGFDIRLLTKVVAAAAKRPLVAIGSGGSLTAAAALAALQQAVNRQLGTVVIVGDAFPFLLRSALEKCQET